jgi:hypothetical protein
MTPIIRLLNTKSAASSRHRSAPWVAGLLGLVAATAAFADGKLVAVTGALETGTKLVSLPGVPSGTLSATECQSGCPILRLRFDGNTRYYIGKDPVPYAKFRVAAAKGDLQLLVVYRYSDKTLTRLRIPAVAAQ